MIRTASADDYDSIVAVVDEWWERPVSASLPRLFLDHFWGTSRIAEDEHGLAGFVVAFIATAGEVAYLHFVAVRPDLRRCGLAARLYAEVESLARQHGCRELRAITAPTNTASVAFHRRLGFAVRGPVPDYNGPGRPMLTFHRLLA